MSTSTSSRIDTAVLVLRVVLGVIFLAHGAQKLFSIGIGGVTQGFAQTGIPAPALMAPFISLLELLGGIALVVGVLTRLAALGLACDMLGAIAFVHFKNGFFNPMGFEVPLLLLTCAVVIALVGAGRFSIDDAIGRRRTASTA